MKIPVRRLTKTKTTRQNCVAIDDSHIRLFLESEGIFLPRDAVITFRVPGGADWSNTDVDVDADNPITISWKEVTDS